MRDSRGVEHLAALAHDAVDGDQPERRPREGRDGEELLWVHLGGAASFRSLRQKNTEDEKETPVSKTMTTSTKC